jgi:hypothetical protein
LFLSMSHALSLSKIYSLGFLSSWWLFRQLLFIFHFSQYLVS